MSNIQAKVDESTQDRQRRFRQRATHHRLVRARSKTPGPVLAFGVLKDTSVKQGDAVAADQIALLGTIPYQDADWYFKTAGIQDFPFGVPRPA